MTALVAVLCGVLGILVGHGINRVAGSFPWPAGLLAPGVRAARPPVVELGTALLFALVGLRFGLSWQLPAFLFLAAAGVLLALVDLLHRLLPDRVVGPSVVVGAGLLCVASAAEHDWAALLRAGLAACALFAAFLALALVSPRSLGMGDVKLAGLLGLYLGWLGWGAVVLGAAAGFVVQALLASVLLAARLVKLRGELPFGPAMLLGASLVIGWSDALR
jgi:leader peptidase (prepilin peptidase)/N-methyltransferase